MCECVGLNCELRRELLLFELRLIVTTANNRRGGEHQLTRATSTTRAPRDGNWHALDSSSMFVLEPHKKGTHHSRLPSVTDCDACCDVDKHLELYLGHLRTESTVAYEVLCRLSTQTCVLGGWNPLTKPLSADYITLHYITVRCRRTNFETGSVVSKNPSLVRVRGPGSLGRVRLRTCGSET